VDKIKMYLLWVLNCFDAVLTKSLMTKFPESVSEANVLMQDVIMSDKDTFIVKIIGTLCLIVIIYYGMKLIKKEKIKYYRLALNSCLIVYSAVVFVQVVFYFLA
jgi:hypothetical protein